MSFPFDDEEYFDLFDETYEINSILELTYNNLDIPIPSTQIVESNESNISMPDIHDDSSVQDDITIDSLINDLTANMVHFVSRPYPPVVIDGEIDDHDRPYSLYGHLDNDTIAHRHHFDLIGTKTIERRHANKHRLSRQMYAITCHTNTHIQIIMHEIQQQFPRGTIQYICISMDNVDVPTIDPPQIYIQIVLTKVINKIGWFLDKITGTDDCNYLVTNNDLAWNEFIKKNRSFYEFGQFRSKRTRVYSNLWALSPFVRSQNAS